jgi:hypothetical protein
MLGLLGTALGLNPNTAGSGAYGAASQNLANVSGVAGQYGNLASTASGYLGQDDPAYHQAAQSEVQYLQNDPYNSPLATAALSQATAGTSRAYQTGQANDVASDAANGISPNSSVAAGQQQGLDIAQAGSQSA